MNWDRFKERLARESGVEIDGALEATGEVVLYIQAHNGDKAADALVRLLVKSYDAGYQYGYNEGITDGTSH